jgi:hypothetical protein
MPLIVPPPHAAFANHQAQQVTEWLQISNPFTCKFIFKQRTNLHFFKYRNGFALF